MHPRIQVFCLTLVRSVDRQKRFSELADKAGLQFDFFYGTDASSAYVTPLSSQPTPRTADAVSTQLSDGEIACADSHRKMYRHVIENRLSGAFIFEDDALFDSRTTQFINELTEAATSMKDRSLVLHASDRDSFKSRLIALSAWARDDRLRQGHIKELWVSESPLVYHSELAKDSLIDEGRRRRNEISKDRDLDEFRRRFRKLVRFFRRTADRLIRYPLLRLKK